MEKGYLIHLNREDPKNIYLSLESMQRKVKYEIIFRETSLLWNEHMKHFQNDFDHFYRVLELTFANNSTDILWKVVNECDEKISLNINYNPGILIFGFDITIEVPREEDRFEQLIRRIDKLERENEYILNLIRPFEENIKNFKFDK